MKTQKLTVLAALAVQMTACADPPPPPEVEVLAIEPARIATGLPAPTDAAGGLIAADLDGDGRPELLLSVPGHIGAYRTDGRTLWTRQVDVQVTVQSEKNGLPGHHGPGLAAGDVAGDGRSEVVYLTRDGMLHVIDGATGEPQASVRPAVPDGAERWEVAMIATFRAGPDLPRDRDRDILLQATNKEGYRMGRYLAAYAMEDLLAGRPPLWTTDDYLGCAHNSARLADLDGDGRDEVLGATLLGPDGRLLQRALPFERHIDSVFVADITPDEPGLEVVLLEEGTDHVQVMGARRVIWRKHHRRQEPQNSVLGRFRPDSDEIFIWCRSRHNEHQTPWVFSSTGDVVHEYKMDHVAPAGWTVRGIEVISPIDWTGQRQQLAAAKERHRSGDLCLFDPLTGEFRYRIKEAADRLYVVDVLGDWREEMVVLAGQEIHIYQNPQPNPRPDQPSPWAERNYRRLKQCHNYYSP